MQVSGFWLTRLAAHHPRTITIVMVAITLASILLAALPSLWPKTFAPLNPVRIDTDPENMLAADEPVRLFHDAEKQRFSLYDMVVVGIVNEEDPDGVFNVETLGRIHALTDYVTTLSWPASGHNGVTTDGDTDEERVVAGDMLALSVVDSIEQAGLGAVRFDWLMPRPPTTPEQARAIRDTALSLPLYNDTLVSADGRAVALYLPITSKDISADVRDAVLAFVADWPAADQVHITGLPVAEDVFGVQMFIQMAIAAPLAMLVIFLTLWLFFRHLVLILSPMIVAMVSAMSTMALLVISGQTVHIMSSMIPVFIMPIAVLDAVHILSEFFDRYQETRDRRKTLHAVIVTLFQPMLFTTLTTVAGFASLALTPIPPVQVFGVFIAVGVFLAWLWTMLFIPAYIMLIPEHRLAGLGSTGHGESVATAAPGLLGRGLRSTGRVVVRRYRLILTGTAVIFAIAAVGLSLIRVNDNPVKWFEPAHPIRIADRVLNDHFGGTYMAYLSLSPAETAETNQEAGTRDLLERLETRRQQAAAENLEGADAVFAAARTKIEGLAPQTADRQALLQAAALWSEAQLEVAGADYFAWDALALFLDAERQRAEVFKDPEVLRYIARLEAHLRDVAVVGKTNSLATLVKTVHRALFLGDADAYRIPDSRRAVAQTLITFQNSHRPDDLFHFVTPDYRSAAIWVQLTSGDNQDMEQVVAAVDAFTAANPPPHALSLNWFGLTYINVVWQEKMVAGMAQALAGSFAVVLVLMVLLFRSVSFGLLCMVPLTVTIGLIYGVIGLIGKDYDMPIAVLSALSLGLAVDYAIHFLARARAAVRAAGSWPAAVGTMFEEPARAISRNAIVLGVGFLPLLMAPLVPYQTVGTFIAAILFTAGLGTLLILPALLTGLDRWLFRSGPETARPDYGP